MGVSGPVLLGFVLAKGEFCCLFILALSSTCDVRGSLAGQCLLPKSQHSDPHLLQPLRHNLCSFALLHAHYCAAATSHNLPALGQ